MPPSGPRLNVTLPSTAVVREPLSVLIEAVDADGRTIPDYTGQVALSADDPHAVLPEPWEFYSIERGRRRFHGLIFRSEGIRRVTAIDSKHGLSGVSAPVMVELHAPIYRLYWGDLHGHSGEYACGEGTIDAYYQFARDTAGLDFCALTDHDQSAGLPYDLSCIWDRTCRAASHYNRPGEFITFLGYEWSSSSSLAACAKGAPAQGYGHKCVYYLGDDEPFYSCVSLRANTPGRLWRCLAGHEALVIPHHPATTEPWWTDWDYHNPDLERLVEVYSAWGSSERAASQGNPYPIRHGGGETPGRHVLDALKRGYELGLIAGGDTHDGAPGRGYAHLPRSEKERRRWTGIYQGGLQAVYARELTRESLWQAMKVRRTYATTGARIGIEFSVGSAPMGSVIKRWPGGAARFIARVEGTADIAHLELVRSGDTIERVPGKGRSMTYEWARNAQPGMAQWFYLRVTQVDGQMAWSSPIWLG
jgi:Protein of unknown function (DUF3604)